MSQAHNRRIARNSAFLYGRMLITMGISLYTSRVVLEMLGVDNYGVYNVVGSLVTIFAFLNGTMSGATQRFLNFEMGRGNSDRLRHTFRSSLLIHIGIAIIVLIAGETAGLWYVNNKLVIDPVRLSAANWTFQLSLAACVCTILQVPYMASVIAHERMDVLAVVSLVNALLKLGVALALALFGNYDTLVVYAWLMLGVSAITLLSYAIYARISFPECKGGGKVPGRVIKDLLGFSLGDTFGNLCYTLRFQSVAIILNRFGGEVLNAAAGLNLTVSGAINQFGTTILSAFRPQIIQQYAAGDLTYMQKLMANCSRYSLLMVSLVAVPAIIGMDFLLRLWLPEVPPFTAAFCRLTLIAGAAELVVYTLNCGVHATGNIKLMSITTGLIYLLEIPLMWFLLKITGIAWIVYAIHIVVIGIIIGVLGLIVKRLIPEFHLARFIGKGVLYPLAIILPAAVAAVAVACIIEISWLSFIASALVSSAIMLGATWRWGLDAQTRFEILQKLHLKSKNKAVK
ncbi:MAG: lipopolysaccharide biosynthesis protein [Muribaculaceae bacterium]|nr:lipopolysaccharide biosynthesis protein [Muribaculaceae bacterium]